MIHRLTDAFWSRQTSKSVIDPDTRVVRIDNPDYMFRRFPKGAKSLLDVGCGTGWLGALARLYKPGIKTVVGVDAFENVLFEDYYDAIYAERFVPFLFGEIKKSFDVVVCLNAIEHHADPFHVLRGMERVARRAVFVSSVNFFYEQGEYDGNPHQKHLSLVTSTDLKRRGYTVVPNGKLVETFGSIAKLFPRLDSQYLAWKYL